jgi:hypothetical protein
MGGCAGSSASRTSFSSSRTSDMFAHLPSRSPEQPHRRTSRRCAISSTRRRSKPVSSTTAQAPYLASRPTTGSSRPAATPAASCASPRPSSLSSPACSTSPAPRRAAPACRSCTAARRWRCSVSSRATRAGLATLATTSSARRCGTRRTPRRTERSAARRASRRARASGSSPAPISTSGRRSTRHPARSATPRPRTTSSTSKPCRTTSCRAPTTCPPATRRPTSSERRGSGDGR